VRAAVLLQRGVTALVVLLLADVAILAADDEELGEPPRVPLAIRRYTTFDVLREIRIALHHRIHPIDG
jgi:hypothetical protein